MNAVQVHLDRRQAVQQGFDFRMLAGIGGKYLEEPVVVRLLLKPCLAGFEALASKRPEPGFGLLWRGGGRGVDLLGRCRGDRGSARDRCGAGGV